jgi:enoyl-CoA hydratase/carnithine racemase
MKMTYEKVMVAVGPNHVAELTLNRPEHLNTLDSQMAEELNQALIKLDGDPPTPAWGSRPSTWA